MNVAELVAKGRAQFDSVQPETTDVLIGDTTVGVRVWPVSGVQWRELTLASPPREKFVWDQNAGYNLLGVVRAYPRVYLVDGDDVTHVSGDEWGQVLDLLSPPDLKLVETLIWGVNEFDPRKRAAAAGKASRAGRQKKPASPAN